MDILGFSSAADVCNSEQVFGRDGGGAWRDPLNERLLALMKCSCSCSKRHPKSWRPWGTRTRTPGEDHNEVWVAVIRPRRLLPFFLAVCHDYNPLEGQFINMDWTGHHLLISQAVHRIATEACAFNGSTALLVFDGHCESIGIILIMEHSFIPILKLFM